MELLRKVVLGVGLGERDNAGTGDACSKPMAYHLVL